MKKKKLLTTLAIAAIVLSAGCKNDDYVAINGGPCPVVISTTPPDGTLMFGRSEVKSVIASEQAARPTIVTATFNKKMDPKTINESTFTVKSTSAIAGVVSYTDSTATFTASSKFADNTTFTARITTGAKDKMGNALQTDHVWSFSTGLTILPIITTTSPFANETGVLLNKSITATFSMPIDQSTINATNFTLNNGTTPVSGVVSGLGNNASFVPTVALSPNTVYTAKISMLVKNTDGIALAKDSTWTFTTVNVYTLDIIAINGTVAKNPNQLSYNSGTNVILTPTPAVGYSFSSWSGDATGSKNPLTVTMNSSKNITANFTSNATNFSLNITAVNGSVLKNPDQLTYIGGSSVQLIATPNQGYTFTGWSGDATGSVSPVTIIMNSNKNVTANFTALIGSGPAVIDLNCAAPYAVLAGSTITSTGMSIINGNVALSPGSALIGFPAGIINGTKEITTPNAADAKLCLTSAFIDGQGRSLNAISLPGQLGGLTLAPGLYSNSSSSGISGTGTNGILTLDAQGNANSVWIFQIGSTLTTDSGTSIVLAGGAQAKNIFWIVGTSATLGTTSIFYGNILADQAITLKTGVILNGRALTRIAAVTLDASTITIPQ